MTNLVISNNKSGSELVESIPISRCIYISEAKNSENVEYSLICFCDASVKAYICHNNLLAAVNFKFLQDRLDICKDTFDSAECDNST